LLTTAPYRQPGDFHYDQTMELGVAGTAVGIASLGIQVCQGLLSYYDAWKSYDSDISSAYDAITDLRDSLTILETILQQEQDTDRVRKVKTCVKNCKDALLGLDKKRKSLQKYSQAEGLRQRMRAGLQRSWYPFKKDTLDALKASVTDVQERLKLALQVLQLGVGTESQKLVLRLLSQSTTQSAATSQIAAQNQRILDAQQSDEFRRIVAWLAPPDPGTNHATARQRHEGQTGDWLLKSSQFQGWKTGATRHLWMYGTLVNRIRTPHTHSSISPSRTIANSLMAIYFDHLSPNSDGGSRVCLCFAGLTKIPREVCQGQMSWRQSC
jgi:hypothetical protein